VDLLHYQLALVLRNSSSGKFVIFGLSWNNGWTIAANQYNSPTSYNGNEVNCAGALSPNMYFRIVDTNTNREYWFSYNGVDWMKIGQNTRTTFMTPDQVGIAINANNSNTTVGNISARFTHFKHY